MMDASTVMDLDQIDSLQQYVQSYLPQIERLIFRRRWNIYTASSCLSVHIKS